MSYDFTLNNQTKVADFQQKVLDNTENDVSSFELIATSGEATSADKMTVGELKQ